MTSISRKKAILNMDRVGAAPVAELKGPESAKASTTCWSVLEPVSPLCAILRAAVLEESSLSDTLRAGRPKALTDNPHRANPASLSHSQTSKGNA